LVAKELPKTSIIDVEENTLRDLYGTQFVRNEKIYFIFVVILLGGTDKTAVI
jgi:hypothetical protein